MSLVRKNCSPGLLAVFVFSVFELIVEDLCYI